MRPEDQLQGQTIQAVGPGAAETVRDEDKIMLVLAYLGLFALIPLLTVKDSEFVKWHAKNGLVLGVGGSIALSLFSAIPFMQLLGCIGFVGLFIVDLLAMSKALKGERWRIPGASDLADKF